MNLARKIIKQIDRMITLIIALLLLLTGLYAVYALWDNRQIYREAENAQAGLLHFKPTVGTEGEGREGDGFQELMDINPDVCAWISMENTGIDYPVVQGKDNLSYISTDVYGNYALAGSIFLDSRNSRDGRDAFNLLYGHYMEKHRLFGDLEEYRQTAFFRSNRFGHFILPDRSFELETLACFQVPAAENLVFNPEFASAHIPEMLDYARDHAEQIDSELLARIKTMEAPKILALTTCSEDYGDSRTVLITIMKEGK